MADDHRERQQTINQLIAELNELDMIRDPERRSFSPRSEPLESDSPAVLLAKARYKEKVSAAKTVYDMVFISALEEWIVALKAEQ